MQVDSTGFDGSSQPQNISRKEAITMLYNRQHRDIIKPQTPSRVVLETGKVKRRWAMKDLFQDPDSKEIIKSFENALENIYGCDSHFVYDVTLEKDGQYYFADYTHDDVDNAFKIHLHALKNLPESLWEYLHNYVVDKSLFDKAYNTIYSNYDKVII